MINFFYGLNPYLQTLIASFIAFLFTVLGAAIVFFFKKINNTVMNACLSISAGIMMSASIFSLLLPAIEQASKIGKNSILIVSISILVGCLLLLFIENIIEKKTSNDSSNIFLLVISILLHNIPEGMSIGVAYASAVYNIDGISIAAAISLSIGIAIQNFPEGASVSIPLRNLGYSRLKSFIISILTGSIEIISALLGALLILKIKVLFPYLLAFASGAMILCIVEELIPSALSDGKKSLMAYLVLIGFVFMMILEI